MSRLKVGIVVDNEFNTDPRIGRQIKIFQELELEIFVLCYGITGKVYSETYGVNVERIWIPYYLKNFLFFFLNTIPLFDWLWCLKIWRFLEKNRINILHVNDLYMSKSSFQAINRARRKIELVLDLHENFPAAIVTYNWTKGIIRRIITQPGKWEKKERRYLAYADYIIVLSDWYKSLLMKKYQFLDSDHLIVLPNYLDLSEIEKFDNEIKIIEFQKTGPVFLYFGIVAERRGIFLAIRAFEQLIREGYKCQFIIIGPVDKADRIRFNNIILDASESNQIIYIPWIDVSYLPAYLRVSDIGIAPFLKNPQHDSGVSNKIFQYMYGELPVIVSDCESQMSLIKKYDCGIVFNNDEGLMEAMKKMILNSSDRIRIGKNGKKAIIEDLNLSRSKIDIISLFNNLKQNLDY